MTPRTGEQDTGQLPETRRLEQTDFERMVEETYDSVASLGDSAPRDRDDDSGLIQKLRVIARVEGFEVDDLLGRGGMGAVVSATDSKLGRRVALKFLTINPRRSDSGVVLKREAERTSRLAHENIVHIYSWHSVGDLTFFSMELVEGMTLDKYLAERKSIDPVDLLRIVAEAAAGVAAAHEKGILHRDIKPQNILIDHQGRVKVADFGLASTAEERGPDSDAPGFISGTIGFMPPEQARCEPESAANDVFSLVATLYYTLTGMPPFGRHASTREHLDANQQGRIVPLFTVRDDLPQGIYRLVAKGLNSDPKRRHADAGKLRKQLVEQIISLSEGDHGPRHRRQLRALYRRHTFWAGFLAGAAAGWLVTFLVFMFV